MRTCTLLLLPSTQPGGTAWLMARRAGEPSARSASGAPWPEKGQCVAGRQYVPSYSEAHRRVDCVLMVTPGAAETSAPSLSSS